MSRSYRKPYAAVTGVRSAKADKTMAHRGVRRAQNRYARALLKDPESDILVPHFRECPWNNTYDWSRDGGKMLQAPGARDWSNHMLAVQGFGYPYSRSHYLAWPPKWFAEYSRK